MPEFRVPDHIASAASRGLGLLEFAGGGLQGKTIREARRMAEGYVDLDKAIRAAAWFARHKADIETPDADAYLRGERNRPTPGQVAWLLWGGQIGRENRDDAQAFFARLVERERENNNS